MTARNDIRDDVAEVLTHGWVCIDRDDEDEREPVYADVDAIVAKLAEGAWHRAWEAQGSPPVQVYDAYSRDVTRRIIAATLGLDPTDVPT